MSQNSLLGVTPMRVDLDIIRRWVQPNSRVLDLGCGDGSLMEMLTSDGHTCIGLEINPINIQACVEKGLSVIEQNLDLGLDNFADKSIDMVVMTQTLQAVHYPDKVLQELLRVGREGVVAFPNFANWRCRYYLGFRGRMPVSKFMPYSWYDTPNLHFCTILDFEQLCRDLGISIVERVVVDEQGNSDWLTRYLPNIFGTTAIYRIKR